MNVLNAVMLAAALHRLGLIAARHSACNSLRAVPKSSHAGPASYMGRKQQ